MFITNKPEASFIETVEREPNEYSSVFVEHMQVMLTPTDKEQVPAYRV